MDGYLDGLMDRLMYEQNSFQFYRILSPIEAIAKQKRERKRAKGERRMPEMKRVYGAIMALDSQRVASKDPPPALCSE